MYTENGSPERFFRVQPTSQIFGANIEIRLRRQNPFLRSIPPRVSRSFLIPSVTSKLLTNPDMPYNYRETRATLLQSLARFSVRKLLQVSGAMRGLTRLQEVAEEADTGGRR